jgi:hypothetical protein
VVYGQANELFVEEFFVERHSKNVLIEQSLGAFPDMCSERRAWSARPCEEQVVRLDVIFLWDLFRTMIKWFCTVVQILDTDDWQAIVGPVRRLERKAIH